MNPPPFLVSFHDRSTFKAALNSDVITVYWNDIESLIDKNLPPLVSVRTVACLFGFSNAFVGALSRRPERHYRSFTIRKGTKARVIHAPKVGLKVIQKWFSWHLAKNLNFDPAVYGFVEGKSAPMAAKVHCGARWVYSLDIENFFPSTSARRVSEALQKIGYPMQSAQLISSLCCYGGNLAQGSPASPVLSNLVFSPSDLVLKRIAVETGLRYTRYADDIVFSGTDSVPANLIERIRAVISGTGWRIAEGKEKLATLPHRLKVHGLVVHGEVPRLTKGYRNRIRAIKHLMENNKVQDQDIFKFQGHLSYAKSVEQIAAS